MVVPRKIGKFRYRGTGSEKGDQLEILKYYPAVSDTRRASEKADCRGKDAADGCWRFEAALDSGIFDYIRAGWMEEIGDLLQNPVGVETEVKNR